MKNPLVREIEERMDEFFASVTDDEFVAILDDLDWKHYATLGAPPVSNAQYSADANASVTLEPKPWALRYRSVPNKTPTQDRLAA